jgi:hypothetical protein
MIIKDISICNNSVVENKFAFRYFKEKTNRIGNIISFLAPVKIENSKESLYAEEAINFLWEVPDVSVISAICIQRIFSSVIGNVLSTPNFLNSKVEINEEKIIVHKEHTQGGVVQPYGQVSLNYLKYINNTCIGYLGIYIKAGNESVTPYAFSTNLKDSNVITQFMMDGSKEFYRMMQSIFLSSSRI